MNKSIFNVLAAALTGLLVSQASMASTPDKFDIARQFREVAQQLSRLKDQNPHDRCAGDVEVAQAYLSAAELKVYYERYDEALVAAHYGNSELKSIAFDRAYCSHFSPSVKPYIARTIRIISELEVLERMKA